MSFLRNNLMQTIANTNKTVLRAKKSGDPMKKYVEHKIKNSIEVLRTFASRWLAYESVFNIIFFLNN